MVIPAKRRVFIAQKNNRTGATLLDSTLLELALSFGFPAWAGVVWFSAVKVTGLIRNLAEQLQQHHVDAEKRLVLLEDAVRRLDKIAEQQDARLREVERAR